MKRMLSLFVVLALLAGLLTALPVFAATTVVASGNCGGEGDGSNLTWTLDSNGTLTISGKGKMGDWFDPWYNYRYDIQKVMVADGVTTIGEWAFYGYGNLTNITIPDSVTSIGEGAFWGCTSLTDITIPDGVTIIGDSAFTSCDSLIKITIPDSVTSIGDSAFFLCTSLTNISVSASNPNYSSKDGNLFDKKQTTLIQYAIGKPDSSYTIPGSVNSIGDDAFFLCTSLTSIDLPNSVTSIGDEVFWECASLTNITIPDSVTSIGEGAFYGCTSLTDVYYEGNQAQWGQIEIGEYNEDLTSAYIHYNSKMPVAVKSISLSKTSTKLHVGGPSETLTVNFTPADADDKTVNWSTTDEGVVKVNGGELIPVAKGTATVTAATPNGKSASCRVTVLGADEGYIADMQINSETGNTATVSLSTVQVPEGSTVYLAACNSRGTLLHMTQAQVRNNAAQGTVTTTGASRIRAFIWDAETLRPITDPESIPLQKD